VSLAVDRNRSDSDTIFDELRVPQQVDERLRGARRTRGEEAPLHAGAAPREVLGKQVPYLVPVVR
jgi:hypothetical protein